MKYLKVIKSVTFSIIMMLVFSSQAMAQENTKVGKAETAFCNSVTTFITDLKALDQANQTGTMDEFTAAYKKADKGWDKVIKKADKLENVEISQSVKAYNKLVDSINKIEGDAKTAGDAEQINENIDSTASAIENILTVICK
jgi:hypothetical protein